VPEDQIAPRRVFLYVEIPLSKRKRSDSDDQGPESK
jgi:hypothetical protein